MNSILDSYLSWIVQQLRALARKAKGSISHNIHDLYFKCTCFTKLSRTLSSQFYTFYFTIQSQIYISKLSAEYTRLAPVEFLLSSDIRSEGSIAIVKKFYFDFFYDLWALHHSHSLKMCFRKNVCVCVCVSVCLSVRRRSQSLNQSTDLVQILYLGSSCKYLEQFFSFSSTPKIKGSSHEKKLKIFIFSKKMVPTILIKFCGFIVHSKPNNMTQSAFPEKIPETEKNCF